MQEESKKENQERKRHNASLRCKLKECNGEPKNKIEATTFCGSICTKCFAVYDYVPLNNEQEKLAKERRKKILEEKEVEKKKEVKENKNKKGDQLGFELE